ncbi:hypothetical protein E2562_031973 [Oryza meyeriana var. granulata]|uniref:Uncharacterized protein n=1 Tax=Oryza meyeriana var. granulata TaxID=110450 RepID=A0A6G1F0E2_9ORYZ|nr:hypothetical protein E2562_031973 [Oryza meyeriana var. granulata]
MAVAMCVGARRQGVWVRAAEWGFCNHTLGPKMSLIMVIFLTKIVTLSRLVDGAHKLGISSGGCAAVAEGVMVCSVLVGEAVVFPTKDSEANKVVYRVLGESATVVPMPSPNGVPNAPGNKAFIEEVIFHYHYEIHGINGDKSLLQRESDAIFNEIKGALLSYRLQ